MSRVYLALGTNLGDRMLNLAHALTLLPTAVKLLRCSGLRDPSLGLP